MTALRVFYEGRVQGVGFRWAVRDVARGYDVCGTVKNLVDGRVELVVCGAEAAEFLKAVRESAMAGHIEREVCEEISLQERPRGFQIVA
jgi:acylphosphatase